MSTQDAADIAFTAHYTQHAFKLLELPAELLALLESATPPTLHLQSSPTAAGHALLRTPEKTYRIQQKNSSNPIMVLRPSISYGGEIPRPSVCTIATIEDTLELLEGEEEKAEAKKVNKWHEKFAKTRGTVSGKGKN